MTKLTSSLKTGLVNQYLRGKTLDQLTNEFGLSKGTVYNTIKTWKDEIGNENFDEIREFITYLNKSNMSVKDCISGFRISQMLNNFDIIDDFENTDVDSIVNEAHVKSDDRNRKHSSINYNYKQQNELMFNNPILSFLSQIYQGCYSLGIKPGDIIQWIQDLLEFSSTFTRQKEDVQYQQNNGSDQADKEMFNIPMTSEIATFIESSKHQLKELKKKEQNASQRTSKLAKREKLEFKKLKNTIKSQKSIYRYYVWYSNLKQSLKKNYDINIEEKFEVFANLIRDFDEYDFDIIKIISEHKTLESQ